jgi:hypothetical protein
MAEGRRSFLGKLLSGVGAVTGLVWAGKASACHRRAVYYCPAPPMQFELQMQHGSYGPIDINFPLPMSNPIYGGGGFFVWGYANGPGNVASKAIVTVGGTDYAGTKLDTPPMPVTAVADRTPFAFRFDQVPATSSNQGTLKTYFKDGNQNEYLGDQRQVFCT